MHPTKLLGILGEPGTGAAIRLVVSDWADDVPYHGWIESEHGHVIGNLTAFRYSFVDPVQPTPKQRRFAAYGGKQADPIRHKTFVPISSPRFERSGKWFELEGYLSGTEAVHATRKSVLKFTSTAHSVELKLHAHPWSGIVDILLDGYVVETVDLYNLAVPIPRHVVIQRGTENPMTVEVVVRGEKNTEAMGWQFIMLGAFEYSEELVNVVYEHQKPTRKGHDFAGRFFDIVKTLPDDAVILDLGGGRRQLDDERYINLEYAGFEEATMFGDGTALPFASNSLDFIYTAAVLEHVKNPLLMGRECHRVLKHGGKLLANAAFMQPIHSEGQHFFNLTPYGLEETYKDFKIENSWTDFSFGDLMGWCVDTLEARRTLPAYEIEEFMRIARLIEKKTPEHRRRYWSSGVWLEGEKR